MTCSILTGHNDLTLQHRDGSYMTYYQLILHLTSQLFLDPLNIKPQFFKDLSIKLVVDKYFIAAKAMIRYLRVKSCQHNREPAQEICKSDNCHKD